MSIKNHANVTHKGQTMSHVITSAARELILWAHYPRERIRWALRYRKTSLKAKHFLLRGVFYPYFIHPYNRTWSNERAVEIPVVLDYIRPCVEGKVLEVGNVLSHYFDMNHVVVDKWEWGIFRKVINQDIFDYAPERKFDLIVSISTIEHIGWDDRPRQPEKVLGIFPKLQSLLCAGGKMVVTAPVGQNPFLDQCLRDRLVPVSDMFCLRRISADNEWVQTSPSTALRSEYGRPFPHANAVLFLVFGNQEHA